MEAKGRHTYLESELPFDVWVMACFGQLCLGGPLYQHLEGYGLQTTVFWEFFYFFLDWLWAIKNYLFPPCGISLS
jgi:hypothetical protein